MFSCFDCTTFSGCSNNLKTLQHEGRKRSNQWNRFTVVPNADSRTEESLPGPPRGGSGGGFASLHSLDILRPLFGLFRPYSESFGSAGFWPTQHNSHTTCMCMHVHANQLQEHVGISAVVTGQRVLSIG